MILRGLKFLRAPGDHARLDQRNHAIGYQFAVHAQIFAIAEEGKHGVGNPADAGLQHGSVFNQAGNVARDRDVQLD